MPRGLFLIAISRAIHKIAQTQVDALYTAEEMPEKGWYLLKIYIINIC